MGLIDACKLSKDEVAALEKAIEAFTVCCILASADKCCGCPYADEIRGLDIDVLKGIVKRSRCTKKQTEEDRRMFKIISALAKKGWSRKQICDEIGISEKQCIRLLRGDLPVRRVLVTAKKIER